MLYAIIKQILGVLAHLLFRVTTRGAANVPADGPVVLCANHIAWWDPILVAYAVRRPVHFMAKRELFRNRLFAAVFRAINAFPVNRGKPDIGAIKAGMTILREGKVLGIFPEGTRQRGGERLGEMHAGAAMFALRTGAPVVPAAIRGSYKIGKPVVLVFGESIRLDVNTGRSSCDLDEGAQVIGRAIAELWNGIKDESRAAAREVG